MIGRCSGACATVRSRPPPRPRGRRPGPRSRVPIGRRQCQGPSRLRVARTPSSDLEPTAVARREGERRSGGLLGPPSRPAATRRGELLGKVALALGLAFLVLSALVAARLLMGLDEFGYAHFVPSASSDPATTNVAER